MILKKACLIFFIFCHLNLSIEHKGATCLSEPIDYVVCGGVCETNMNKYIVEENSKLKVCQPAEFATKNIQFTCPDSSTVYRKTEIVLECACSKISSDNLK